MEKQNNFYLNIVEITNILELEDLELKKEFEKLSDVQKQYAAEKATLKIENLGIENSRKREGGLTFPLPFQKELTLDIKICFALETAYIALKKVSEEINIANSGIVAESDKMASATYDKSLLNSLKDCTFNCLEAYKIIKKYIPKSCYVR